MSLGEPYGVALGRLRIGFERTLRLPDDGKAYPLPPGLGPLPMRRLAECGAHVPAAWRDGAGPDDLLLALHEHEALFLVFAGEEWRPSAVKVGLGGVDAVAGLPWSDNLHVAPQNYLVCPPQPWLDGINAGSGIVRQFMATSLGRGHTVEGQVTARERTGGIQLLVWDAKPGRFPDHPPEPDRAAPEEAGLEGVAAAPAAMGLGAGGHMRQRIYPDPYGLDAWAPIPAASLRVHLVRADEWPALTGEDVPPRTVTAALYAAHGLPWFTLDDADRGDVPGAPALAGVRSVQDLRREQGDEPDDEASLDPAGRIVTLEPPAAPAPAASRTTPPEEERS